MFLDAVGTYETCQRGRAPRLATEPRGLRNGASCLEIEGFDNLTQDRSIPNDQAGHQSVAPTHDRRHGDPPAERAESLKPKRIPWTRRKTRAMPPRC